jgi:hypothetical protein
MPIRDASIDPVTGELVDNTQGGGGLVVRRPRPELSVLAMHLVDVRSSLTLLRSLEGLRQLKVLRSRRLPHRPELSAVRGDRCDQDQNTDDPEILAQAPVNRQALQP